MVNRGWDARAKKRLIIISSALVFALAGVWWIRVTGVSGGARNCEGPPGKGVCVSYPPSWGWQIFGIVLGAVLGCIVSMVVLRVSRRAGRHMEHHS
jgi:hypothetical protein